MDGSKMVKTAYHNKQAWSLYLIDRQGALKKVQVCQVVTTCTSYLLLMMYLYNNIGKCTIPYTFDVRHRA